MNALHEITTILCENVVIFVILQIELNGQNEVNFYFDSRTVLNNFTNSRTDSANDICPKTQIMQWTVVRIVFTFTGYAKSAISIPNNGSNFVQTEKKFVLPRGLFHPLDVFAILWRMFSANVGYHQYFGWILFNAEEGYHQCCGGTIQYCGGNPLVLSGLLSGCDFAPRF